MQYKIDHPFALIIFGASGDLAKIKLFPAIYQLKKQHRLPKDFYLIGFARSTRTNEQFKEEFRQSIKDKIKDADDKLINELTEKIYYFQGKYDDINSFKELKKFCKKITKNNDITKIAYFSVPPIAFEGIIKNLGETKSHENEDIRLVIEKPFGEDCESATKLFHNTARYFKEEQVYLLDHYLAKAAVQSIMHLRHGNRIFNLLMKGSEIANIQITSFEDIGIKNRVSYFDQVGIIKDMIQSHLLQILALLCMSIPISKEGKSIHREKNSLISALIFKNSSRNISLGQYSTYKKLPDAAKNSKTETFAALKLMIDRESWHNVPIYLRSGKMLHKKHTYIVVEFKKFSFQSEEEPNRLIIELQPEEKITLKLLNKQGIHAEYDEINTSQSIAYLGNDPLPEHAILLLDSIRKSKDRFLSFDEIISSWKLTDSIINFLKSHNLKVDTYQDQSTGPNSQHKIPLKDGFTWYDQEIK